MNRAILQKNWLILKNMPVYIHIGLIAFMFLFAFVSGTILGPMIGTNVYILGLMTEIFREDENNQTLRYTKGLPISSFKITNSTYFCYLMLSLIAFIISFVIGLVSVKLWGLDPEQLYELVFGSLSFMVIYSAMIPICIKFKIKMAMPIFMAYIVVYSFIIALFLYMMGIFSEPFNAERAYLIVGSVSAVMFLINYVLSIIFVKNYK